MEDDSSNFLVVARQSSRLFQASDCLLMRRESKLAGKMPLFEQLKVADLYEDMLKYGLEFTLDNNFSHKRSTTFKKDRSLILPVKKKEARPSVKVSST
jgi:hypothetical protein